MTPQSGFRRREDSDNPPPRTLGHLSPIGRAGSKSRPRAFLHGVTEDWGLFFSVAEREQVALDGSIEGLLLAEYKRVYGQPWYEVGVSAGTNRKGSRAAKKRAQRERE